MLSNSAGQFAKFLGFQQANRQNSAADGDLGVCESSELTFA